MVTGGSESGMKPAILVEVVEGGVAVWRGCWYLWAVSGLVGK